ncbi:Uncharacterised protein [Mycobacteroides abscessus subsp. abscessus]|nr:Uncharacterised protein [Mycobacteroides abscessus subsp. abscessus]
MGARGGEYDSWVIAATLPMTVTAANARTAMPNTRSLASFGLAVVIGAVSSAGVSLIDPSPRLLDATPR